MATVTISMPDSLKEFVDQQVRIQGYGNVSEYFRSMVREAQTKEAERRLEALLLEGLGSGDNHEANQAFWQDLKAEAARLLEGRQRRGG